MWKLDPLGLGWQTHSNWTGQGKCCMLFQFQEFQESSFLSDFKNRKENTVRSSGNHSVNSSTVAGSTMLPRVTKVIETITINNFVESRSFENQMNQIHPLKRIRAWRWCCGLLQQPALPEGNFWTDCHSYLSSQRRKLFIKLQFVPEEVT